MRTSKTPHLCTCRAYGCASGTERNTLYKPALVVSGKYISWDDLQRHRAADAIQNNISPKLDQEHASSEAALRRITEFQKDATSRHEKVASPVTPHAELFAFAQWLQTEHLRLDPSPGQDLMLREATAQTLKLVEEYQEDLSCRLTTEKVQRRLLNGISERLINHHSAFIFPSILEFTVSPKSRDQSRAPNYSVTSIPAHSELKAFEDWLASQISDVKSLIPVTGDIHMLHSKLLAELQRQTAVLEDAKITEWNRQVNWDTTIPIVDADRYFRRQKHRSKWSTIAGGYNVLVGILRRGFQLSEPKTKTFLAAQRPLLRQIGGDDEETLATLDDMYKQPESAIRSLELTPVTVVYASCPECHQIYERDNQGQYPTICTNRAAPKEMQCGTALLGRRKAKSSDGTTWVESLLPKRVFNYYPVHEWFAEMLSRPGVEDLMDGTWAHAQEGGGSAVTDIIQAEMLRNFRGADGKPFYGPPSQEGRYTLSYNVDGFDLLHNKAAGKQHSAQGMYAVSSDLPEHLRYLPEYVYLIGIMPGPEKPSLNSINHMMRPFIDDLAVSYEKGTFISRTHNHSKGRLIRVAIVPVVADMPGGRAMAGFPVSTAAKGCTCCKEENWKHSLDCDNWTPRTAGEFRARAQEWANLGTVKEREKHFATHGVRDSILLKLPYWDPVRMLTPDAMHIWFLGLFWTLCRMIYGMNVSLEDDDEHTLAKPPVIPAEDIREALHTLEFGGQRDLENLKFDVLKALCVEVGLPKGRTRAACLDTLDTMRIQRKWPRIQITDILTPSGNIVSLSHVEFSTRVLRRGDDTQFLSLSSDALEILYARSVQPRRAGTASAEAKKSSQADLIQSLMHIRARNANIQLEGWGPYNLEIPEPSIDADPLDPVPEISPTSRFEYGVQVVQRGPAQQLCRLGLDDLRVLFAHYVRFEEGEDPSAMAKNLQKPSLLAALRTLRTGNAAENVPGWGPYNAHIPHVATGNFEDNVPAKERNAIEKATSHHQIQLLHKEVLLRFCAAEGLVAPDEHVNKDALLDRIRKWRVDNEFADAAGTPLAPSATRQRVPEKVILGTKTLAAHDQNALSIHFPDYVGPVPRGVGTKTGGKLSANGWRTFCTISLLFTLIHLWGHYQEGRYHDLLDNFVHLVIAVRIGCRRTMTPEVIRIYSVHMHAHLAGLQELFPKLELTSKQHAAMHLPSFFKGFGPVHGWWCFHFERFNGMLARLVSNHHPGEIEATVMHNFIERGVLLGALRTTSLDPNVLEAANRMSRDVAPESRRGTLFENDIAGPTPTQNSKQTDFRETMPEDVYQGLLDLLHSDTILDRSAPRFKDRRGVCNGSERLLDPLWRPQSKVLVKNIQFTTRTAAQSNSFIRFHDSSRLSHAGQIQHIFQHRRQTNNAGVSTLETFLAIRAYRPVPASHRKHNPYLRFPDLDGALYLNDFESGCFVIRLQDILFHLAVFMHGHKVLGPCIATLPVIVADLVSGPYQGTRQEADE